MKPATPLPLKVSKYRGGSGVLIDTAYGAACASAEDAELAAYLCHAANAYPELVKALREMVPYANAEMQIGWNAPERNQIDAARALLAKLGEQ